MNSTPKTADGTNNHNTHDDDQDSFSSDSEDEFLVTMRSAAAGGAAGSSADREALVRKKLLESFYGTSSVNKDDARGSARLTTGGATFSDSKDSDDDDDDDDDEDHPHSSLPTSQQESWRSEDLDAPNFNATAHTQKLVHSSGVHPLLATEESLACQVRTLDSTLQTLVYENYSRFIEATDAIRNIDVQVQANHQNLESLQQNMLLVSNASQSIEQTVGTLRDQVVEKLRVRRLLQRLDTLLKLPTTLRQQIQTGKYRWATQSYLNLSSILSKHSKGFESLQRIETECQAILQALLIQVRRKLIHWSGDVLLLNQSAADYAGSNLLHSHDNDDDDHDEHKEREDGAQLPKQPPSLSITLMESDNDPIPDPPQSIVEILECAGTPPLILEQHQQLFDPRLTTEECKEMALVAALRLLERILDAHHFDVQQHRHHQQQPTQQQLTSPMASALRLPDSTNPQSSNMTNTSATSPGPNAATTSTTSHLVPTNVLDNILEASTLYSMSFLAHTSTKGDLVDSDGNNEDDLGVENANNKLHGKPTSASSSVGGHDERLAQFVLMAFNSFLQHVRGEFLDQIMWHQQQHQQKVAAKKGISSSIVNKSTANSAEDAKTQEGEEPEDEYDEDSAFEQISVAMSTLIVSVRQLASGLSLPEVMVSPEFASSLVDQTIGLTEAMVRRRVDQKFHSLRLRVVQNCLSPFCKAVAALSADKTTNGDGRVQQVQAQLLEAVQLASVSLSDSLQLMDDTVRSILATTSDESASSTVPNNNPADSASAVTTSDDSMLKEAVQQSTRRFAKWLAGAMELLAGCESSDPRVLLQIPKSIEENPDEDYGMHAPSRSYGSDSVVSPSSKNQQTSMIADDSSVVTTSDPGDHDRVEMALRTLLDVTEPSNETILAIAEMCRVAERVIMDNINQSIATHGGGGLKQRKGTTNKGGLFSEDGKSPNAAKNPISERFRLAASRVLNLYAMSRGLQAANLLCSSLSALSQDNHLLSDNEGTTDMAQGPRPVVFDVLEMAKATCRDCADLFGGDMRAGPTPDTLEDEYVSLTSALARQNTSRSGLVFDVERMFHEKVDIYPHPNEASDFQRNSIVALFFKVAFKALGESARFVTFSVSGYRQLVVDVEFLKWFLPHYVKDEALPDGSNARTASESFLLEVTQIAKDRCLGNGQLDDDVGERNQARAVIRHYMSMQEGQLSFVITKE